MLYEADNRRRFLERRNDTADELDLTVGFRIDLEETADIRSGHLERAKGSRPF